MGKFLVISIVFISGCAQILGFDEKKDPLPYLGKDGEDVTSDALNDKKDGNCSGENIFEKISAGGYHTCALMSTGGVKCWGDNFFGQLGDRTITTQRYTPVDVVCL